MRGGTTEDGKRLLSVATVRRMTHGKLEGLDRTSILANMLKVTGTGDAPSFFNFGMAMSPKTANSPHTCGWGGYAKNFGTLYPDEDSYLLVFPQFMGSSVGGMKYADKIIKHPAIEKFLSLWN